MNRVAIRVIGAPLILAGLALCVYADNVRHTTSAITVLIGCFAAVSFHELCAMGRLKGLKPAEVLGLLAIIVNFAFVLRLTGTSARFELVTLVYLTALLLLLVFRHKSRTPPDLAFGLFAYMYVSLLLFVTTSSDWSRDWNYWLLFLVATNKGSDMAAYVVGKSLGRRKLAPAISPNKTWEGSIGGLIVGSMLGYVVLRAWYAHAPDEFHMGYRGIFAEPESLVAFLVASAGVTIAAQLGDLVKSAIKRWAGVKDSGRFLPEFGGALDMVDSFILSAPVAAWLVLGRF